MFGLSLKSKDRGFKEKFNAFLQNKNSLNHSVKDDVHQIIGHNLPLLKQIIEQEGNLSRDTHDLR